MIYSFVRTKLLLHPNLNPKKATTTFHSKMPQWHNNTRTFINNEAAILFFYCIFIFKFFLFNLILLNSKADPFYILYIYYFILISLLLNSMRWSFKLWLKDKIKKEKAICKTREKWVANLKGDRKCFLAHPFSFLLKFSLFSF